MIDRITALFRRTAATPEDSDPTSHDETVRVAAAALLVEAAMMDETFDDRERAHVFDLLSARFSLSAEETRALIAKAEQAVADSTQWLAFTRVLKDGFSHDERIEMVEMLWQVVYADGVLHDHQASLMRQIGSLVYITDRERGEARKRALGRLGVAPDAAKP